MYGPLTSIIESALHHTPIRIRTASTTLRSFVAIDELLSLAVALVLAPGQVSICFDTAGERVLEITDLIATINQCIPNRSPLERPALTGQLDRYLGDREPYAALLDRHAIAPVSLEDQLLWTAEYIRQNPSA